MTSRLAARALSCALAAIPLAVSTLARADAASGTDAAATVDLDATTVTARSQRGFAASTAEVGSFRGQSLRDIPATVNVVTREALDAQQDRTLYDALRNTAGVTRQQLSGETFDNLAIRGVTLENRTNFRLNGSMPVFNLMAIPLEDKERVEVLKGVSALYYGYTTPGGMVNLVTKRAGNTPVTSVACRSTATAPPSPTSTWPAASAKTTSTACASMPRAAGWDRPPAASTAIARWRAWPSTGRSTAA